MEHKKLIEEIDGLPPLAQRQVFDFISFLKSRYHQPLQNRQAAKTALADEPFIGMWKNRTDMSDGASWVRNLRNSEWKLKE